MIYIIRFAAAGLCLSLSLSLHAQTADDCIAQFESFNTEFTEVALANGLERAPVANCVQEGHIISLDAEGPMRPVSCEGGKWDHWHLEAKAILGPNPACVLMLRGLQDREGCGSEEIRKDLPANEGARWRNYLREQCQN